MKHIAMIAVLTSLTACITSNPELFETPPSLWTENEFAVAQSAPNSFEDLCRIYREGTNGFRQLSDADRKALNVALKRKGLNNRDLEMLNDPDYQFATGQSYLGLKCKHSWRVSVINEAFYQGTGHQWQAELDGSYIYLRGNNTDTGMIVYAWN
jgi:hypothetical protein